MDIGDTCTHLIRRPGPPTSIPLPSHIRRTPRGSINKSGLSLPSSIIPPHISRRAQHLGLKLLQREIWDEILGTRATGCRRPMFSALRELRPRTTQSLTALKRRSGSPWNTVVVDEGSSATLSKIPHHRRQNSNNPQSQFHSAGRDVQPHKSCLFPFATSVFYIIIRQKEQDGPQQWASNTERRRTWLM